MGKGIKITVPVDPDSVRLMREYENLRSQLQELDELDSTTQDDMTAARVEFDMLSRRYDERATATSRARRELEAKFYNLRNQLGEVLGQVQLSPVCGDASARDSRR